MKISGQAMITFADLINIGRQVSVTPIYCLYLTPKLLLLLINVLGLVCYIKLFAR